MLVMAKRAIVVGGGIGGLATAISLNHAGWEVQVFERQEQFVEIGAGLTLWPNALAALDALGVGDGARDTALSEFDGGFMTASGRWLTRLNTDAVRDRYGEVVVMARPDLLSLLLGAVPVEWLHANETVQSVTADGTVKTSDGEYLADLVVGADGVWSAVRQQLWPGVAQPRYSGFTAWRFNTDVLEEPVPDGAWVWGGRQSFGYTPLPGGRAYAYAIERTAPGDDSRDLRHFADWRDPIPRLIASVSEDQILRHDVYEGPMLKSFVNGRVALVGDSAHAMQPSLGQGACQALEDAVTLGRYADDLPAYDKARRRRTQRIVRESRVVMNAAHVSSTVGSAVRNVAFAAVPQALNLRMMKPDWAWKPPERLGASRGR